MINIEQLEKINEHFIAERIHFDQKDFEYILNRGKLSTRFNDFLTIAYYQRKNLITKGFIGVCYTYKIALSDGKEKNHRTFALFSPNRNSMIDEQYYQRVIKNIDKLAKKSTTSYKEKKFLNYYSLVDSKPRYFKIDPKLSEGKILYLQYIELIDALNPNFKLGLNFVIYAPLISKELIYLPKKYIIE